MTLLPVCGCLELFYFVPPIISNEKTKKFVAFRFLRRKAQSRQSPTFLQFFKEKLCNVNKLKVRKFLHEISFFQILLLKTRPLYLVESVACMKDKEFQVHFNVKTPGQKPI